MSATTRLRIAVSIGLICLAAAGIDRSEAADPNGTRLRLIIETDAGGDPDDEQSLVRFLLYVNEWDVEGIIANRPHARDGENLNPERTGFGIVRRLLKAYGECYPNLVRHDPRYPKPGHLWQRTIAGYDDSDAAVKLIIATVDSPDPRPVWYSDWGTDDGSCTNNLQRALDRVRIERGQEGYAKFKSRLRLASADAFGDHTTKLEPPFPLWVNTFRPELDRRRWYHRFSALTATAGGFDAERHLLRGGGPLGRLYPTNTTHRQKEGDTMTFLYLVPTGMNDPDQPTGGSWAGRYGLNPEFPGRAYYWANQQDTWQGTTHRENSLARFAADLQNDFRARLDWCTKPPDEANHSPTAVLNGNRGKEIVHLSARPRASIELSADGSSDRDSDKLSYYWLVYPEAGTYRGEVMLENTDGPQTKLQVPRDAAGKMIHVLLTVRDDGTPPLAAYRRIIVKGVE
jgi:cellulose-binding protein